MGKDCNLFDAKGSEGSEIEFLVIEFGVVSDNSRLDLGTAFNTVFSNSAGLRPLHSRGCGCDGRLGFSSV